MLWSFSSDAAENLQRLPRDMLSERLLITAKPIR
jgi:hypothetical protein